MNDPENTHSHAFHGPGQSLCKNLLRSAEGSALLSLLVGGSLSRLFKDDLLKQSDGSIPRRQLLLQRHQLEGVCSDRERGCIDWPLLLGALRVESVEHFFPAVGSESYLLQCLQSSCDWSIEV